MIWYLRGTYLKMGIKLAAFVWKKEQTFKHAAAMNIISIALSNGTRESRNVPSAERNPA
jgi:hypothetical protein